MLATAKGLLADRLNTLYPTLEAAGRILHPDDQEDVAALVAADEANPVVILHSPQLVGSGPINRYTCPISICGKTENATLSFADTLLSALRIVSPVAPTNFAAPSATVIREEGFWRAATSVAIFSRD